MADAADLLDGLKTHLIGAGVVRDAGTAGALPPIFLQPEGGAPAPGDKKGTENHADLIVSAFHSGGFPARPYEEELRQDTVDVWLRARRMPYASACEAAIRAALLLNPPGPRSFDMGPLRVISCREWRPFQPAEGLGPGHSFVVAFSFDYHVG